MSDKTEDLKNKITELTKKNELKELELSRVKSSRAFWERMADGLYEHRGGCYSSCSDKRCIIDEYEDAKEGNEGTDYVALSYALLEANSKALDLIDELRARVNSLENKEEAT